MNSALNELGNNEISELLNIHFFKTGFSSQIYYYEQRFGSGSGTFWVEAEAEAEPNFQNHLEAEAETQALVKKNWKRKRK